MTPNDANAFRFTEGRYKLKVFAHILGDKSRKELFSEIFDISSEEARQLETIDAGIYFDWGPDSDRYISFIDRRPSNVKLDAILENLLVEAKDVEEAPRKKRPTPK